MTDERTTGSTNPPIDQYSVEHDPEKSQICNRHITHVTTIIVDNNQCTTIYTLGVCLEKKDSKIYPSITLK